MQLQLESTISHPLLIDASQTSHVDNGRKCNDLDGWKGEFLLAFPKIKYEVTSSKKPLSFKWYNVEKEILGRK